MYTTEKRTGELVVPNFPLMLAEDLMTLLDQPLDLRVRSLAYLCRRLSQQYQEAQQACWTRSWWRLFNQAGIQLREALDHAKAKGYPGLSDQETEQAYFLLIHVAYFFEPGGIVEMVWPLLPAELGDWRAKPPASTAMGFDFAPLPPTPGRERMRQQVRRSFQRLGQFLGRSSAHERGDSQLLALTVQSQPLLEEEIEQGTFSSNKEVF